MFQNLDNVCRNEMAMLKISTLHAGKILETQPLETFWIRSTFTIKHIHKTDIACLKSCWEKKGKTTPVVGRASSIVNKNLMNTLSLLNLNQNGSWSQPFAYDKNSCIICQPPGVPLHKLAYTQTGESMHNLAQKMTDEELLIHLNSFPNAADAVASNVQYYLKCWV